MAHYGAQCEIDFGDFPIEQSDFVVADAAITADSVVFGAVAYAAPTGKDLDELEMDDLSLRFGVGDGFITINARGQTGLVSGKFKINYGRLK